MSDIVNGIVLIVPAQWMPAVNPQGLPVPGGQSVVINFKLWTGDPALWATTVAQTNTLTSSLLRAVGAVMLSVLGGAGGSTVAAIGPSDPKVVVGTATVSGRANLTLQFQDATTSANIGARVDLDAPSNYAKRVAETFAAMSGL